MKESRFLSGFVVDEGHVWERPVGVTLASDGSLLVSNDGSNAIWRVVHTGNQCRASDGLLHSLVLSLSKDERFGSWLDKLTTSGCPRISLAPG